MNGTILYYQNIQRRKNKNYNYNDHLCTFTTTDYILRHIIITILLQIGTHVSTT